MLFFACIIFGNGYINFFNERLIRKKISALCNVTVSKIRKGKIKPFSIAAFFV